MMLAAKLGVQKSRTADRVNVKVPLFERRHNAASLQALVEQSDSAIALRVRTCAWIEPPATEGAAYIVFRMTSC